ncbi:helix-turn-helix domain-containing protein [Streptomyces sp. NBC_01264]|uniref:helix-turn-helix domain-containing protein n=1 Tax=Streptomyces sp. NBC_01264 TaxID=2903804 RepID=UPI0022540DF5|nr:helix-turn-helix domain-containing protein [Streptomyces sp. NBC_01264]MCX4780927.1 helix-turn-helix domain-containing protein [Streptomyces sp. NBC_01264]
MHVELIPHAQRQPVERLRPLRVKDVAVALGVDVSTVYLAVRTGLLGSYRVGAGRGTIRIPRSALKAYADERGIPTSELAVAL